MDLNSIGWRRFFENMQMSRGSEEKLVSLNCVFFFMFYENKYIYGGLCISKLIYIMLFGRIWTLKYVTVQIPVLFDSNSGVTEFF